MEHDKECMCDLCSLDKTTNWEQSGDVLSVNDPTDDDDGGVAVLPPPVVPEDPDGEGLVAPTTPADIADCLSGMVSNGRVEEVLVIVNDKDDDQYLLTTVDRNDQIVGMLEIAKMNWHRNQISVLSYLEDDEEGGDYDSD